MRYRRGFSCASRSASSRRDSDGVSAAGHLGQRLPCHESTGVRHETRELPDLKTEVRRTSGDSKEARERRPSGRSGGRTSASASGEPCARTTAQTGDAWNYFPHDHARSRAYRWGEDGIAGISDDQQQLCFALALWNGKDPILKERLFGLTNSEGNHGEDVKEYYFYLDSTPTHSYMKYLYKYPQAAFPYDDLVATNRAPVAQRPGVRAARHRRLRRRPLFRCLRRVRQSGAGGHPRSGSRPRNRGPEAAELHLLPTLWFRNDWAPWIAEATERRKPASQAGQGDGGTAWSRQLTRCWANSSCHCEGEVPLLFTDNETNNERLFRVARMPARTSRTASTTTSSQNDPAR